MSIFIPKQINVGFQERKGTYTGKLAYIIYFDEKGKLRKETSWQNWRDKNIQNELFDNEPTDGFVLNKDVGGIGYSHWDSRKTYVRVYDPRGFEFEISIPNLLWILQNCNCIKGKGLEGEFVYGWDGTELLLVPVESPDYKEIEEKNEVIYNNAFIKAKDLVVGATYLSLNGEQLIYMGKFKPWSWDKRETYQKDKFDEEHGWHKTHIKHDYCSYYSYKHGNVYRNEQLDKAEFFFIELGDTNAVNSWDRKDKVIHMKTVTRKLVKMICGINGRYAYYLDLLNGCRDYSPYDYKSEKIVTLPFENFESALIKLVKDSSESEYRLQKHFGIKFSEHSEVFLDSATVFYDKETNRFYRELTKMESYICKTWFGEREDYRQVMYREYYETIRELYDKLNPVYGISYLQNGHEFERRYYYGTNE